MKRPFEQCHTTCDLLKSLLFPLPTKAALLCPLWETARIFPLDSVEVNVGNVKRTRTEKRFKLMIRDPPKKQLQDLQVMVDFIHKQALKSPDKKAEIYCYVDGTTRGMEVVSMKTYSHIPRTSGVIFPERVDGGFFGDSKTWDVLPEYSFYDNVVIQSSLFHLVS